MNFLAAKININSRKLFLTAFAMLTAPFLVFVFTHMLWGWAVLLGALLITGMVILGKSLDRSDSFQVSRGALLLMVLLAAGITVIGGIGGYIPQKLDHAYRNALLYDLVNSPWPVTFSTSPLRVLVYYYNFWLVPCLAAKIFLPFGENVAVEAGHALLLLWSISFVVVAMLLLLRYFRAGNWHQVLIACGIFLGFSGMDFLGNVLINREVFSDHYEWWAGSFQFSSHCTQLAWVFNQALPAWVCTLLLLNMPRMRYMGCIVACCLICAPFPAVGLFFTSAFLIMAEFIDARRKNEVKAWFKELASWENILFCIAIVPCMWLFFRTNSTVSNSFRIGLNVHGINSLIRYILFILGEFLLLAWLLRRYNRDVNYKVWYLAVVVQLLLLPVFNVISADFCMRVSLPALTILSVLAIKYFLVDREVGKFDFKFYAILSILVIGAVTPFAELYSSVRAAFTRKQYRDLRIVSYSNRYHIAEFTDNGILNNFVSQDVSNTPFFKYFARKSSGIADSCVNRDIRKLLAEQPRDKDLTAGCAIQQKMSVYYYREWFFVVLPEQKDCCIYLWKNNKLTPVNNNREIVKPGERIERKTAPGNRDFYVPVTIKLFEDGDLLVFASRKLDNLPAMQMQDKAFCGYQQVLVVNPRKIYQDNLQ